MIDTPHDSVHCDDPICQSCLETSRNESVIALEAVLLDAELTYDHGEHVDSSVTVDWLDVRNVLDLARGVA